MAIVSQELAVQRVSEICEKLKYTVEPFVYVGFKTKLIMKCQNNHLINTIDYEKLLKGRTCKFCNKIQKKVKIPEKVLSSIKNCCEENNYILENFEYIGTQHTVLNLKCSHGHKWTTKYRYLHEGNYKCKTCNKSKVLSEKQEMYNKLVQDECKKRNFICEEFVFNGVEKTILPLTCENGHKIKRTMLNSFLSGVGCKKCFHFSKIGKLDIDPKVAYKKVINKCKEKNYILPNGFEFTGVKCRIHLKCGTCDFEWNGCYDNFLRDSSTCKRCKNKKRADSQRHSEEYVSVHINNKLTEYNFTLIGNFVYKNVDSKLKLACNLGHKFTKLFRELVYEDSSKICPICANFKKSSRKLQVLDEVISGYDVENEIRFKNCRHKRCLPFDRYIKELNLLIEFDGEQHFNHNTTWYSSPEKFLENKKRDMIKTIYAISQGYNFIRVSCFEDYVNALKNYIVFLTKTDKQVIQIYGQIFIL